MRLLFLIGAILIGTGFLTAQGPSSMSWRMKTFAGGTEAGDGGRATQASIRFLQGVAIAPDGTLYIADADDHRIRAVSRTGEIRTIAGTGLPGFSGDGGMGAEARIQTPYGVAVQGNGDVIFADLGNSRLRRIGRDGMISTIAGGGTRSIPAPGPGIPALEVRLVAPRNLYAAANGNLYFSDFGANRILVLTPDGMVATVFGGALDWNAPAGLTLDAQGHLVIADSGNARVRRLRTNGIVETILQSTRELTLERPTAVLRRPDDSFLVTDTRGDYLIQLLPDSSTSTVATGGRDVVVDEQNRIVTVGGPWLRRVNALGMVEILIGNQFTNFRGDGGPALASRLNQPTGIVVDSKGNVYIADTANHRVRCVDRNGNIVTVAGAGDAGFRGDGGPATAALLHSPTYLAIDAFDNIYVADAGNHRVRAFAPQGPIQTVLGNGRTDYSAEGLAPLQTSVHTPAGLVVDREGNVAVVERGHHRVRRFRPNSLLGVETIAGNGLRGHAANMAEATLASLNAPTALAMDAAGTLYIADTGNNSIRALERSRLRTVTAAARGVEGLLPLANGELLWTEANTHTVRSLAPSGEIRTVAGITASNGFNVDAGDATTITLNEPAALALGANGVVYVADRRNQRVRALEPLTPLLANVVAAPSRFLHAATLEEGPVAPGLLMTFATTALTNLEYLEVTVDSFPALITYKSATQVNFQIPESIAGRPQVTLEVRTGGALHTRSLLGVQGAAPAFFEQADSRGLIAAANALGEPVTDANPARAGDLVSLYATGQGLMLADGSAPFLPITLTLDGVVVTPVFVGSAPGVVGVLQIHCRIPAGLRLTGRLPLALRVGGFTNPVRQSLPIR